MTTPSTPVSFQRVRSPFGQGVVTQANSQLFAAARPAADIRLCWAAPGNGDGSVAEYRAEGYKLVLPKDVEELNGGEYLPKEKDVGVYVEIDKKADRVTGRGGMVLMWTHGANYRAIQAEQARLGEIFANKSRQVEKDNGGVDNGGSEISIEETVKQEALSEILK